MVGAVNKLRNVQSNPVIEEPLPIEATDNAEMRLENFIQKEFEGKNYFSFNQVLESIIFYHILQAYAAAFDAHLIQSS